MDKFKKGDKVGWNSEAGHVSGHIIGVHYNPFKINGYTKHATKDDPVYGIKSDISDHIAYHFSKALHKI